MSNTIIDKKIAGAMFKRIGTLLELSGDNDFKIRAYQQGARIVESFPGDLEDLARQSMDGKIKGIGKALAEKLDMLVRTGDLPFLAELEQSFPAGLTDLLDIPGLGPKSVRKLHLSLGINTLNDLETACASGKILDTTGFSEKSRQNILAGIRSLRSYEGRFRLSTALATAEAVKNHLTAASVNSEIAGSVRRRMETVRDVDIVAAFTNEKEIEDVLRALPEVEKIERAEGGKIVAGFTSGLSCEIFPSNPDAFGAVLTFHTGSKDHLAKLAERAAEKGLEFGDRGLRRIGNGAVSTPDDAAFYKALDLAFISPELRENRGEIEAAVAGTLPKLVEESDLRGVIHVHTLYSDGTAGIAEMAEAARGLGYSYLAVSDHSKSSTVAGGMKEDDIRRQHDEIDAWNETNPGFRILKGIECDILKDGSLDYPDEILSLFDFLIASVHSNFHMSRDEMTARVVAAASHPHTTLLGHPTGRILLHREPYQVDMEKVLEACAVSGCAIEINANPYRLDLDWRLVGQAVRAGIKLVIGPDAHSVSQLDFTRFGVYTARKGWAEGKDILNTLTWEAFLDFSKRRRKWTD